MKNGREGVVYANYRVVWRDSSGKKQGSVFNGSIRMDGPLPMSWDGVTRGLRDDFGRDGNHALYARFVKMTLADRHFRESREQGFLDNNDKVQFIENALERIADGRDKMLFHLLASTNDLKLYDTVEVVICGRNDSEKALGADRFSGEHGFLYEGG